MAQSPKELLIMLGLEIDPETFRLMNDTGIVGSFTPGERYYTITINNSPETQDLLKLVKDLDPIDVN